MNSFGLKNYKYLIEEIKNILFNLIRINRYPNKTSFGLLGEKDIDFAVYVFSNYLNFDTDESSKNIGILELFNDMRPKIGYFGFPLLNFFLKDEVKKHLLQTFLSHTIKTLGFNESLSKHYISRKTGKTWGEDLPIFFIDDNRYDGHRIKILSTPMLKQYAAKRFNKTHFLNDIPMGVEILTSNIKELNFVPHPRVYYGEISSISLLLPLYLSDLTLCMLEDMGWYSTNFSYAYDLPWGNQKFLNKKLDYNFSNDSPRKVYPEHYMPSSMNSNFQGCSYDFQSFFIQVDNLPFLNNHDDPDPDIENEFSWYKQGYSQNYFGQSCLIDFPPAERDIFQNRPDLFYSTKYGPNSACIYADYGSEVKSLKSGCYEIVCSENNDYFDVISEGKAFTCSYEGEKFNLSRNYLTHTIYCPNPENVCIFKKKKVSKIFNDYERINFPLDFEEIKNKTKNSKLEINL